MEEESHTGRRSSSPEQHGKQPSGSTWASSPHASEIALLEQLSRSKNTERFRNNEVLPSSSAWMYPYISSESKLLEQLCRMENLEVLRNNEALSSGSVCIPSAPASERTLPGMLCRISNIGKLVNNEDVPSGSAWIPPRSMSEMELLDSYVGPRTLRKWTTEGRSPRLVRTYHHAQHASLPLLPVR